MKLHNDLVESISIEIEHREKSYFQPLGSSPLLISNEKAKHKKRKIPTSRCRVYRYILTLTRYGALSTGFASLFSFIIVPLILLKIYICISKRDGSRYSIQYILDVGTIDTYFFRFHHSLSESISTHKNT